MASKHAQQAGRSIGNKPLGPSHPFTFSFEEDFDVPKTIEWFNKYAYAPFFIGIVVYLSMIYFGQKIMANREPLKLKGPLVVWNSALAIFSILGFARVFPEFLYTWRTFGFQHTICNNSYMQSRPTAFWTYLFVLSKTPELMDTLFLVLKKQQLIFLHVYHHATVLIFSWFIFAHQIAGARWYCTMNFGVHAVMYSYYALKAFPQLISIPKWVSMVITTSQTLQMVAGTYVVASSFHAHLGGKPCDTSLIMSIAGLVIYVSYLFLFSHFFYKAYLAPRPAKARDGGAAGKKNV